MAVKKLGLKQRYAHMTRGLDWETTYQPMDKVFPYDTFEGIKIKDWSAWEDPFRLTMDAYWKFQAEKERKLYAVLDAFAQNNGQTKISDGRYANVVKLFLTGISPEEYQAHRGFAFAGRHLRGVGPRVAAQQQSLDELRHIQTQIHTISHYNKFFDGISEFPHMHDRVWYLSVPKSFFDDARTAGPFEFMIAIGFAFEYVLTNLLFVPFMSGAAYNGDMSTVTFGFSAQSDESRHMTLGIEVIKFLLEQHPDNLPIVQKWVDKWFWRGHKVLGIVAMMMDYMLPKKVMSWREAWDIYFTEAGGSLFQDLARYGLRPPKYADQATVEADHVSHQNWAVFYQYSHAAAFHTWAPDREHLDWLSREVPDHVRQVLSAALGDVGRDGEAGQALLQHGAAAALPDLPDPDGLYRAGRSDDDLFPPVEVQGRNLSLLLGRLQRHLRRRAGEVCPVLAAGAPDLPGQLRRRDHSGRAELLPSQRRPRQHGLRRLAGRSAVEQLAGGRGQGRGIVQP